MFFGWAVMYFVAGAPMTLLLALAGLVVAIGGVAYGHSEHFARRIDGFLYPDFDPTSQLGYATNAIREGGILGVGVGEGQVKWSLPDAHTDFIFSILIEELGLMAGVLIIGMLFGISFRMFLIGRQSLQIRNHFGFFFCYGSAILIGLHVFINVGVATGLLPTKGLTLPLFSAGGTNILIMCSMIGLILRIDYENKISMPIASAKRRATF